MYYPELLEIIKKTGAKEAVEKLDKYLAFLPKDSRNLITTSGVTTLLGLDYNIVDSILNEAYKLDLLEKIYIIVCPECSREIYTMTKEELVDKVNYINYYLKECNKCNKEIYIQEDDVYVGYKLIKHITRDRKAVIEETNKIFGDDYQKKNSENLKELFSKSTEKPHDFFYKPSKEKLNELIKIYESLDNEFDTTTEKGKPLEGLVLELFGLCRAMTGTLVIKTPNNQIDCTIRNDCFIDLTVYRELGSIFRCECKNENKKPGNGYYHKLAGIVGLSKSPLEQGVGILVSRKEVPATCKRLARDYFLRENIIIINLYDEDLKDILYDNVNLLDRVQEKIQEVKGNFSTNVTKHCLYR